MTIEYQIEVEYVESGNRAHLSFAFNDAETRNKVYKELCEVFAEDIVDMDYLRENDSIIVSTYNYNRNSRDEMAQMIPMIFFKFDALNGIRATITEKVNS
ncbi:hypothetical protein ACFOZY_03245 [Chungangia koreensis]|uniref:Phage protein n=1 Tax=Chungangia koreensis TaxID=752657 RepID=A0ABV8X349_9LACT